MGAVAQLQSGGLSSWPRARVRSTAGMSADRGRMWPPPVDLTAASDAETSPRFLFPPSPPELPSLPWAVE